jgi:hypothetical protein
MHWEMGKGRSKGTKLQLHKMNTSSPNLLYSTGLHLIHK